MSIEAINGHLEKDEISSFEKSSSTWNGREVRCKPLDEEEAVIRAMALIHLAAHKEGLQAVRKIEQEIYALGSLDEEEEVEDEPDPEWDAIMAVAQACEATPELLQSEERVKLLLNDPTRFKPDLFVLYKKDYKDRVVKAVRNTGRKVKKGGKKTGKWIKKHKKEAIIIGAVAAAVVITAVTVGAASGAAAAGVAAAASAANNNGDRRKEEEDKPSPPQNSSAPPPPPNPHAGPASPIKNPTSAAPEMNPGNLSSVNPMSHAWAVPGGTFSNMGHYSNSISPPIKKVDPYLPPVTENHLAQQSNTPSVELHPPTEGNRGQGVISALAHTFVKTVGMVVNEALGVIDAFFGGSAKPLGPQQGTHIKDAWENETVPRMHEKVDEICSTNLKDEFDPKKDGPLEKFGQGVLLNPLTGIGGVGNVKAVGGLAKEAAVAEELAVATQAVGKASKIETVVVHGENGLEIACQTKPVEESLANLVHEEANVKTTGFSGSKGFELKQPEFQKFTMNDPTIIDGRVYSGHAIDKMQLRGIKPSLVEDTIKNGKMLVGKEPNTVAYYYDKHNITVILNENGEVITTGFGIINQ